jgi:hypothetical protein
MLGDASTMVATDGSSDTLLGDSDSYGDYSYSEGDGTGVDYGY